MRIRILIPLVLSMGFLMVQPLIAQSVINIFNKEETLFNSQLQELTGLGLGVKFQNDIFLEKKINTYQFYLASPIGEIGDSGSLGLFLGYNISMQNYQWWPLDSHLAYVHRIFTGGNIQSWWGNVLLGASCRWRLNFVHEVTGLAEKEEAQPYLDLPSFMFDITPVANGTLNTRALVARAGAVFGSFLNTSLLFKLINQRLFSFWPGLMYENIYKSPNYKIEKDLSHIGLSVKLAIGDTMVDVSSLDSLENYIKNVANVIFFSGRIGLITSADELASTIASLPENWWDKVYFYGETCLGFIILGAWYEKQYGLGYSIGLGFDSLGNVRQAEYDEWSLVSYALYIKLKYNDAMIEPLYRGSAGTWSLVLELSQKEHGKGK
ncbi:hypothetical protein [Treponema sp. J25]|uniref:hypothetical protein n=1 Tax=Treponema sp. J25 TaxID=2094121 RepID=UPI0010449AB0|nr:hypothetical protein [Treponema sp. J25]